MSVLVYASGRALRQARELRLGVIETEVERLVETDQPVLRIGRELVYEVDCRTRVRVRKIGRTPQGRRRLQIVGVIDTKRPPGR